MAGRPEFPGIAQLRELPLQLAMQVPPEWEDRNGHVNVQFYLTLYELGGYQLLEDAGVGEEFLRAHNIGMFDFSHHINYLAEIHVGDQVSCYNRVLGMNSRRFHGMYFIVNDSRERLACTVEYITAGVDLLKRRTAPFPAELQAGMQRQFDLHARLNWTVPLCGSLGP